MYCDSSYCDRGRRRGAGGAARGRTADTLDHATLEQFVFRVSLIRTATEGADEVPAERLVDALLTLEHATLEQHLRITFELLDTRGDGSIARENMVEILKVGRRAGHPPRIVIATAPAISTLQSANLCGRGGGRTLKRAGNSLQH